MCAECRERKYNKNDEKIPVENKKKYPTITSYKKVTKNANHDATLSSPQIFHISSKLSDSSD